MIYSCSQGNSGSKAGNNPCSVVFTRPVRGANIKPKSRPTNTSPTSEGAKKIMRKKARPLSPGRFSNRARLSESGSCTQTEPAAKVAVLRTAFQKRGSPNMKVKFSSPTQAEVFGPKVC